MVIPMFNEELNIVHALDCAIDALESFTSSYEIIVIDDASTDRSAELVREVATRCSNVRLLQHEKNRKLGGSLRTGFAAATKDLVLYMDADLPFDPQAIGPAIRAMQVTRADMVAAYRIDRTTEGFKRTIYSYAYNTVIGMLFGWPHRDINFSFKLMRREVLETVDLRSEGSLIDAELVVKARNLGFVIQQIGLDYFPRTQGHSTLSSPGVILKIFRELIALRADMRNPRRRNVRTIERGVIESQTQATGS